MSVHIFASLGVHVQAVPATLHVGGFAIINPWKFFDDTRQFWEGVIQVLCQSAGKTTPCHTSNTGPAPFELALRQFNEVQWLLYQRHIKRSGWRTEVSPGRECWRFSQWTRRHSKNFRQLLALYQIDWFRRYADLTANCTDRAEQSTFQSTELEQLFIEIELHLYQ